jgi:hypothetical protein
LRVRKDGPGWGVQAYFPEYGDWTFVNQEPFPSRAEAVDFMADGAPERNWELICREWARGLL